MTQPSANPSVLQVTALPAFNDNYIWALHDDSHCVIVDPGDAAVVEEFLAAQALTLTALLITHHHGDHVGGLKALAATHAVPVYGPSNETIDGITHTVADGATLTLPGLGAEAVVFATPGHTLDHIAFLVASHLFAGDTLFAGGCGRLFEGSAQQMHESLQKLMALPDTTQLYCGHEYTLSNLCFALEVEPDNVTLRQRLAEVEHQRAAQQATLPSRLAEEAQTNPFVRTHVEAVKAAAQRFDPQCDDSPVAVFAALRKWKDQV